MIQDTREEVDPAVGPAARGRARHPLLRGRVLAPVALLLVTVLLSPLWLRRMDYFRVRRVEVVGARYIQPKALLDLLAVDSSTTIWHDLGGLTDRVKAHPQVRDASISRRLPGTLVLRVAENLPVALIATADGLQPLDRDARALPIDPTRMPVDLPIVTRRDTAALQMLDGVRAGAPELFARISEIRWDAGGGLRVILSGLTVRATSGTTADRFVEIIPVEEDLVRRGKRPVELDLRYRDQIVARVE
jgi:cell division protein FtsQ